MRIEHWFYEAPLRLRTLFRRSRVEQDLDDELQYHLEQKIAEFAARGLTPQQARQAALRSMDGLTQCREQCRDMRKVNFIDDALLDIRYGVRKLRKSPGFAAVAILTLALAIGANAVVFGVLNGMIIRPLHVPRAESLYGIEHGHEYSMEESYPDYLDLRDRNRSFDGLAAFCLTEVGIDAGEGSSRSSGYLVSGNYFDVMGIQPYLGHFFRPSDEHGPNSAPYIVLSYAYWHDHFSNDRSVLGHVVRLNRHAFTVIGVAPPDFHGTMLFIYPDFYIPLVHAEQVQWGSLMGTDLLNNRENHWVFMTLGHLKPGVTRQQAIADLNAIGAYLDETYPAGHGHTTFTLARPSLYGNYMGAPARAFLTGLLLLAGLILLAACANLGSLFAARAADRSRELAMRLALGAGRSRILRTLFTEAMLLSLIGGAAGLFGSVVLLEKLSAWRPIAGIDAHVAVDPDIRVYAVALGLALVSGILFGMVPVRQVMRTDPYEIVKAGSKVTGGKRVTFRDFLLAAQIAICAVLVTSSFVAVRGLARSMHAHLGFQARNAMLVDADLTMAGYHAGEAAAMQRLMIDAVEKIPGVTAVGSVEWGQLITTYANSMPVFPDDATDFKPSNAIATPATYRISPDYLRAAGTELLAGRSFTWHDDDHAPRVAIINQEFARRIFGPETKAIGRYFKAEAGARVQIIGIVEDGKYNSLTENPRAAMFIPVAQWPSNATTLVVRSDHDPKQLAAALRATLHGLDPGIPAVIGPYEAALDVPLFPARLATVALGILGIMGAMLAATGIFGMAAYSVSRRLRELGIRLALGARRKEVLQAALGRSLKLLAFGSTAGLILGILASRVLAAIVYQATPRDPLVLTGVVLAMAFLGFLATWIPAQRALSLDPVTLLREE